MKKILFLIYAAALMLTGCASKNDVAMVNSYYKANTAHNVQQTAQVSSKATAIKDSVAINCNEADPNCAVAKAMSGVVSAMFISGIAPQEFTIDAPVTGVAAQERGIKTLASGIPWLTVGVVSVKGMDSAGDKTSATDSTVTQTKAGNDYTTTETITELATEEPEEEVFVDESATAE